MQVRYNLSYYRVSGPENSGTFDLRRILAMS